MKDTNPMLSVVVPVYNVEKYLERCVDSIINQIYTNLEIILVDDGSKDLSGVICDKYLEKDARIKVIHKENGGLVSARKAGVKVAKGAYITHVDSDDWIEHNMYNEMMELMVANDADIITSGVYRDYGKYVVTEVDNFSEGVYTKEEIVDLIYPKLIYTGVFFQSGINVHLYNKIYKREILCEKQLLIDDNIRIGEDAALVYPCFLATNKVVITHECYYHYCIRHDSVMGTSSEREYERIQLLSLYLKNEIDKYNQKANLLKQLKYYIKYLILLKEPQSLIKKNRDGLIEPFDKLVEGSKVILYGAGKFGKSFYESVQRTKVCEIVLWVDKNENSQNNIYAIDAIDDLNKDAYDYIVIGVLVEKVVNEIIDELRNKGIKEDKIAKINIEVEE